MKPIYQVITFVALIVLIPVIYMSLFTERSNLGFLEAQSPEPPTKAPLWVQWWCITDRHGSEQVSMRNEAELAEKIHALLVADLEYPVLRQKLTDHLPMLTGDEQITSVSVEWFGLDCAYKYIYAVFHWEADNGLTGTNVAWIKMGLDCEPKSVTFPPMMAY